MQCGDNKLHRWMCSNFTMITSFKTTNSKLLLPLLYKCLLLTDCSSSQLQLLKVLDLICKAPLHHHLHWTTKSAHECPTGSKALKFELESTHIWANIGRSRSIKISLSFFWAALTLTAIFMIPANVFAETIIPQQCRANTELGLAGDLGKNSQ